jgi:hypothetical protein
VAVDYVRLHWGSPDSVRLGAAVLWRGTTNWRANHAGAESERARTAIDSALRDAGNRGVQSGGTITAHANAWVEFDEAANAVTVLRTRHVLPTRDSALVLLVDRVDSVGGKPTISSLTVACPATSGMALGRGNPSDAVIEGMRTATRHWQTCLLSDARIAGFVSPSDEKR